MPARASSIAGWATFAFLIGCCGYLALAACDLGIRPLFALRYCSVPASPDRLADQRARETGLRDRIHEAEMRLARLPVCAAPSPSPLPPEPKKEAKVVPPTPQPTPTPQPSPTATPELPEQLKIPKNLSELKGCWQSVQGDLHMTMTSTTRRAMFGSAIVSAIAVEAQSTPSTPMASDVGRRCRLAYIAIGWS
jgi:hypothetical protein